MTTLQLISLFLCGAALSLMSAAAGAFLTLWCAHVARTGCSPIPSAPKISLFKRKPVDEDEDDEATNGHPRLKQPRVGP